MIKAGAKFTESGNDLPCRTYPLLEFGLGFFPFWLLRRLIFRPNFATRRTRRFKVPPVTTIIRKQNGCRTRGDLVNFPDN